MTNAEGLHLTLMEIFGGIAHEINNPLSIIYGKSAQLKRKVEMGQISPEQLLQDLSKIEAMSDRISKIIKNFNSFLKHNYAEQVDHVQLDSIFEQSHVICTERFRNHGIQLDLEVQVGIEINTIESRLAHLVINLFILCFKFCKQFNINKIGIRAVTNQSHLTISIQSDTPVEMKSLSPECQAFLRITTDLATSLQGSLIESRHNSVLMIHLPLGN